MVGKKETGGGVRGRRRKEGDIGGGPRPEYKAILVLVNGR